MAVSEFGRVLRRARAVTGVTQAHISKKAAKHRTSIGDYIRANGPVPDAATREAIARAMLLPPRLFDVPPSVALNMLKRLEMGEIYPQWYTGWEVPETGVSSASGAERAAKRRVVPKAAERRQ